MRCTRLPRGLFWRLPIRGVPLEVGVLYLMLRPPCGAVRVVW